MGQLKGTIKSYGFCRDINCKNGQTINFCTAEVEINGVGTVYASGMTEDIKNNVGNSVNVNAEYSDKYEKYLFSIQTLGSKTDDNLVTERLNQLFKKGE